MKKSNVFKFSAISLAFVAIAVLSFVACSKNNSESSTAQPAEKVEDCRWPIIFECYYFHQTINGIDTCTNHHCVPDGYYPTLCYMDLTCMEQHPGPDLPPIINPNGADSNIVLCLPNYSHDCEWMEDLFEEYFEQGEITFTCDCPAGSPSFVDYLPEGYLPAGTYPISKHGKDAWIDITLAVK